MLALAGVIAGAASGASAAERGVIDYKVYFGGFAAIALEIDLARTARHYRISTTVRTLGVIDMLFPWTMRAYSRGRLEGAELRPEAAGHTSAWRGQQRIVEILYRDGRATVERVVPAPDRDERAPVPDEDVGGTIDLAGAVLSMSLAIEAGHGCAGRVRVFDGRRRYDLVAERIGIEAVRRFGRAGYVPRALKCRVTMERRSGFRKSGDYGKSDMDGRDGSDADRRAGTVWFAPPGAGMPPVPVSIEVETKWGLVIAHLLRARPAPAGDAKDSPARRP